MERQRRLVGAVALVTGITLLAGTAMAHGGSLRGASAGSVAAPTWLVVLTGGGVVAASFLLATFVTDRGLVRATHDWHRVLRPLRQLRPRAGTDALASVPRVLGVVGLLVVILVGYFGPTAGLSNLAVLLVWVGWWSGFTMTTYLIGNAWPTLNPWRTLSSWLSVDGFRALPDRLGAWPAAVGLLALVWLEVVSPLADDPPLLATAVVGYSVATLLGATVFGRDRWFATVDPISRTFATYGRLAPITRTGDGFELRLPGAGLTQPAKLSEPIEPAEPAEPAELASSREPGEVAFVLALLWATTYDGFVATPAWAKLVRWIVGLGFPPRVAYLIGMVAGFGLFYGVFVAAARRARRAADTYLTPECIARWFAPSLVPIAAGYHLAHFLGYFLSLSPALAVALAEPSGGSVARVLVLPSWFGGLELWFVLLGHLLAVGVAHATAYRLFPGRLQAVRSQYPFVVAMVVYTTTSLWIVSRPTVTPPFL